MGPPGWFVGLGMVTALCFYCILKTNKKIYLTFLTGIFNSKPLHAKIAVMSISLDNGLCSTSEPIGCLSFKVRNKPATRPLVDPVCYSKHAFGTTHVKISSDLHCELLLIALLFGT